MSDGVMAVTPISLSPERPKTYYLPFAVIYCTSIRFFVKRESELANDDNVLDLHVVR